MSLETHVSIFYDPGSETRQEDGFFICPPFYGVLDGVSGIYHPDKGPQLFRGMSGAQVVVKIICRTFFNASPYENLDFLAKRANENVHRFAARNNIPFTVDFLPAAAFVVMKIEGPSIEILQGGDCIAIWEKSDGATDWTTNQVYRYKKYRKEDVGIVAELMKKYHGSRPKMWEEYLPIFAARKMKSINQQGGIALINGQRNMPLYWQRVILHTRVSRLILFTDGFVPPYAIEGERNLAGRVFSFYDAIGLSGIMAQTRREEERKKNVSHVDHAEATCLAIDLISGGN